MAFLCSNGGAKMLEPWNERKRCAPPPPPPLFKLATTAFQCLAAPAMHIDQSSHMSSSRFCMILMPQLALSLLHATDTINISLLAKGNIYAMLVRRQTGNDVATLSPETLSSCFEVVVWPF